MENKIIFNGKIKKTGTSVGIIIPKFFLNQNLINFEKLYEIEIKEK